MGATTQIKAKLPGRHVTDAPADTVLRSAASLDRFGLAEIFKKTPSAADSQRVGRHLAKELAETADIQIPATPLLDHSTFAGDRPTVTLSTVGVGVAGSDAADGNLTDFAVWARPSEQGLRETDRRLGALWMDSRQIRPEMQCDDV
jgi:hypothetical protein